MRRPNSTSPHHSAPRLGSRQISALSQFRTLLYTATSMLAAMETPQDGNFLPKLFTSSFENFIRFFLVLHAKVSISSERCFFPFLSGEDYRKALNKVKKSSLKVYAANWDLKRFSIYCRHFKTPLVPSVTYLKLCLAMEKKVQRRLKKED